MINKVNTNRALSVKAIHFNDDKAPLKNCIIYVLDRFIIVFNDADDTAPTWYNIDTIKQLDGVTVYTATTPPARPQATYKDAWQNVW